MEVERLTLSEWAEALPDSGFEVFHAPAALEVLAAHAPGELRLYGGFKGDQPVALLPTFVREPAVGRVVTSPPPSMGVPRLGPLLMPNSPKQRKRETVNRRFTEAVLEDLAVDDSLALCRIACPLGFDDPRPFGWGDLSVRPSFTYVVDLDRPLEDVRGAFSSSLRRELRTLEELDVTVEVGGVDAARLVYDDIERRFAEQGETHGPDWPYVRDLVAALGDRARAYVARSPEGEYLTGIVALYSNDAVYFWEGGARASYENASANTLLHWRIMADAIEDPPASPVSGYDLVGANTERLCRYKSKFGGEVVPYYVAESEGASMDIAKRAYQLVAR